MDSEHPKQEFSCTFVGIPTEDLAHQLEEMVDHLRTVRDWTINAPEVARFGESDGESDSIGLILDVYSALPPWGERLPTPIDRAQYEEVKALIEAISKLSLELRQEVECYLGDVYVGSIDSGQPDRLVSEGLLGEWEKQLASKG